MSVSVQVALDPNANAKLRALFAPIVTPEGRVNPGALEEAGASVRDTVQRHLENLPANKQGYPTTNFWKRAARSTSFGLLTGQDGVLVSIAQQGIRQRLHGGTISKRDKMLTIPANAEAYGKTASDFGGRLAYMPLFGAKAKGALVMLQNVGSQLVKKPRGKGFKKAASKIELRVMFWLLDKVTQAANPDVLPAAETMQDSAIRGLRRYLRTFAKGGAA